MERLEHDMALVSIIVITYNSSKYVLETLESAKAQTYQNIELIISDDASQDDTVEICKNWLTKNQERFVCSEIITVEKNTGISANCNRGITTSKGEWVKLIAGDDILRDDCIEQNLSFAFNKSDCNIILSKCLLFKNENGERKYLHELPLEEQIEFFELSAREQYKQLLEGNFVWTAPTLFINRMFLNSVGNYDEKYPMCEDYPFWLKTTKQGFRLRYLDFVTILYRQSESVSNSTCKWMNSAYFLSIKTVYQNDIYPILRYHNLSLSKRKKYYFLKYYILIFIFRNKRSLLAKAFNIFFDKAIPNSPL